MLKTMSSHIYHDFIDQAREEEVNYQGPVWFASIIWSRPAADLLQHSWYPYVVGWLGCLLPDCDNFSSCGCMLVIIEAQKNKSFLNFTDQWSTGRVLSKFLSSIWNEIGKLICLYFVLFVQVKYITIYLYFNNIKIYFKALSAWPFQHILSFSWNCRKTPGNMHRKIVNSKA